MLNPANSAKATSAKHKTVLLQEAIEHLGLEEGGNKTFVDATYGGGGHSQEVARRYPKVKVIGIDQDPAVNPKPEILNPKLEFRRGNFRNIDQILGEIRPDAILFDLGWSTDQLAGKGMSFMHDEPLDMRLGGPRREDGGVNFSAKDVVNNWSEEALELIIRGFGEERNSRRIARAIMEERSFAPINTTLELAQIIESVVPRRGRIHPATKTFQALRITVNEELTALEEGLAKGWQILNSGGRMAVISFHSLEDRIVKRFFKEKVEERSGEFINSPRLGPGGARKPIVPSEEELERNPRSRSAKLRIIKKL